MLWFSVIQDRFIGEKKIQSGVTVFLYTGRQITYPEERSSLHTILSVLPAVRVQLKYTQLLMQTLLTGDQT